MKTATLDGPAGPAITSTVGALSDCALLRQTSTLVRHGRHLQGAVIDHLGEIEARRLYLRRGCSSLPGTGDAGRPGAPARRRPLRVESEHRHRMPPEAGATPRAPFARGPAHDDRATRRPHRASRGGRRRQEALDRHDPSRPPRRARARNRPVDGDSKPASASTEQGARKRGHASTGQDAAVHDRTNPTAEWTSGAMRQPAAAFAPSPLQDAASPAGTTPTAEWTAERTPQPSRQGAMDHRAAAQRIPTGAVTSTAKPRATGRAIPAAVRRQVWQRDGGRCSYVDRQTGRRCSSRHLIEIDHIMPYALGGGADPENLRLVCRAHHRLRHPPHD